MFNFIGTTAERQATYGRGAGGIFLDDLQCNGTEARLFDCPRNTAQHNCYHAKDAGVTCTTSEWSALLLINMITVITPCY